MVHDETFWRVLLPTAGIAAGAMFAATLPAGPAVALVVVLLLVAVWHARWVGAWLQESLWSLSERTDAHAGEPRQTPDGGLFSRAIPRSGRERDQQRESRLPPSDGTPQTQINERVKNSELLHAVLTTMGEGVIVVDRDEQVLYVNDAARSLMDFVTREVVSRPLWEVSRSPALQKVMRHVLEQGEHVHTEIAIPRTNAVISLTAAALPHDPVPGAVLVLHDVTELRRLETLRRDFVTNVSHELKTPLTAIQAYADTLLDGDVEDPQLAQRFLAKIVTESERLHRLILDVIRLGRIESHQELLHAEAVPVAAVVAQCLEAHTAVAASRQIQVVAEAPPQPLSILADTEELRTILDNLVGNALKYTPPGGTVQLRWFARETFAVIEVEDSGVGIPRDQQPRVFERFYRVDRARDRERGGTGLGLSIVKHLCQLFGGSVEVDSEMGRGSLFRVRLPLAADRAAPEDAHEVRESLLRTKDSQVS